MAAPNPEEIKPGDLLPRAESAVIERAKLEDYALNKTHLLGKHKAAVFSGALGIEADDWEYLRDAVLAGVRENAVVKANEARGEFGDRTFEIPMTVQGIHAKAQNERVVTTAWCMDSGVPRLVSIYMRGK